MGWCRIEQEKLLRDRGFVSGYVGPASELEGRVSSLRVVVTRDPKAMLIFVVLLSVLVSAQAGEDEQCGGRDTKKSSTEERLAEAILCGYARGTRPVKDQRTAVVVAVHMRLRYISFDALEETLSVHTWLVLNWVDEYLYWKPEDHGGLKELEISSRKIWQPELSLYNADASTNQWASLSKPCVVNNTGHVLCVPHLVRSAICTTKLRNWPYDTQNCTMRFGSWMHTGEQVKFIFGNNTGEMAVSQEDFVSGAGWALVGAAYERLHGAYEGYYPNNTFPELRYYIALKRHAAGLAAIVVVPSVVIVLLTLSSLLMDVKNNTRLWLACFCMFGHFLFLRQIGHNLPKHSSDTPIILTFLRDSMVLNLVGILVTLLLGRLRMRTDMPYFWINWINNLFSGDAKFAVFTEFEPGIQYDKSDDQKEPSEPEEARIAANLAWVAFCNVLNSVTFALIVLVYLILIFSYLPKQ